MFVLLLCLNNVLSLYWFVMHIHIDLHMFILSVFLQFNLMKVYFISVDFTNLEPPVMDGLDALLAVSMSF